jgi:hypothetical protein
MKNQTRTLRRWVCLALVTLLASACKPHPLLCVTQAVFQPLNPEQDVGAAPFNIDRLGPAVKAGILHNVPDGITLTGRHRARVHWSLLGHIYGYGDLIYSPDEGLARNIDDPKRVYPMRRFSDGTSERVRFGFRSTACRDPTQGTVSCEFGKEQLFLVAEMTCHPDDS